MNRDMMLGCREREIDDRFTRTKPENELNMQREIIE